MYLTHQLEVTGTMTITLVDLLNMYYQLKYSRQSPIIPCERDWRGKVLLS